MIIDPDDVRNVSYPALLRCQSDFSLRRSGAVVHPLIMRRSSTSRLIVLRSDVWPACQAFLLPRVRRSRLFVCHFRCCEMETSDILIVLKRQDDEIVGYVWAVAQKTDGLFSVRSMIFTSVWNLMSVHIRICAFNRCFYTQRESKTSMTSVMLFKIW